MVDVVATLAIAAVALTIIIGGIAQAGRVASLQEDRIAELMEAENGLAQGAGQVLTFDK